MDKIVWQPEFYSGCEFKVFVDNDFAMKMLGITMSREQQNRMNELAKEKLESRGIKWPAPYSFHENTAFIHQIYIGGNGKWLSTNMPDLERRIKAGGLPKPIEYNSHNIDYPSEAFALLQLVDMWHYYSNIYGD